MSFINGVMAEEADRKGLILFDDYSVIRDIDFQSFGKGRILKTSYWRNFLLVLIILFSIIHFINKLPVSYHAVNSYYSESLRLADNAVSKVGNLTPAPRQEHQVDAFKVEDYPAAIQLEVAQTQFKSLPVVTLDKVSEIGEGQSVFEQKSLTERIQNSVDIQYNHALMLRQQGRINSAIMELHQLLSVDQSHLEARILLAATLIEKNQTAEAIMVYQQGLITSPREPRLAQPLAHLLIQDGDLDKAIGILHQAAPSIQLAPEYYSFIAALEQRAGRHEKAINVYQPILKIQPDNGKWWLGMGISLMVKARDQEALLAFEQSLHDQRVSESLKQFASQRIQDLKTQGD